MATSLEESEKLVRIDNIHANTFYLVKKNRENRSSRSWDSFAQFKEKKEITEGKIYSPVGKFAERAKLGTVDVRWQQIFSA